MKCKIEYIKLNGTDITPSSGFQDLGKCSNISETLDLIGQVAPMILSENFHRDSTGLILKYRPDEVVEYSCTVVPDLDPHRELSIKLTIEVKERYDEEHVPVQLSCLWSFSGDDTFCRFTSLNATFSPFNRDVPVSVEDDDPSDSWLTHRSEVDYFIIPALRILWGVDQGGAGITAAGARYILPGTTLKASSCDLLGGLYKYYNPGYHALLGISEIRRTIEPAYNRLRIKFCSSSGEEIELGENYFGPDLRFVFSAFFQIGLLLSKGDVFLLRVAKNGKFSDPRVYEMLVSDLTDLSQDLGIPVYLEQLL